MNAMENPIKADVSELVLVRLYSQKAGETPHATTMELRKLLGTLYSPTELRSLVDQAVASLVQAGHLRKVRRTSVMIQGSGERMVSSLLGPNVPRSWKRVRELYLLLCLALRIRGAIHSQSTRKGPGQSPLPADEKGFAERVLSAARASKTGRFGDDKVFVSHVLRQLQAEGFAIPDVDAFKERLVAAHRAKLLSLSRADLVQAMAAEDVDGSETRYLNARFHFVRI